MRWHVRKVGSAARSASLSASAAEQKSTHAQPSTEQRVRKLRRLCSATAVLPPLVLLVQQLLVLVLVLALLVLLLVKLLVLLLRLLLLLFRHLLRPRSCSAVCKCANAAIG